MTLETCSFAVQSTRRAQLSDDDKASPQQLACGLLLRRIELSRWITSGSVRSCLVIALLQ